MTPQEIADYAMDYLDSKGIAAEYEMTSYVVYVCVKGSLLIFQEGENKNDIRASLNLFI